MHVLKLPNGDWLNLDYVRRLEYEYDTVLQKSIVKLYYSNGDTAIYQGTSADELVKEMDMLNGGAITTSKEELIINSLAMGIAVQALAVGSSQSNQQWSAWLTQKAEEQYGLMSEEQREDFLEKIDNFRLGMNR